MSEQATKTNDMPWDEWFTELFLHLSDYDICGYDEPWSVLKDLYDDNTHPEDAARIIYMES